MADFYERHVGPVFTDAAPDAPAQLLTRVEERLKQFKLNREKDEETLRLAQFQNAAQRIAAEAYRTNETDEAGYVRNYRDAMRKIPTPVAQQGRYGAIVEAVEGRYLWTIAANQEKARRESLKYNAMDTANGFVRTGLRVSDGILQSPDPALETYENFTNATGLLLSTAADGSPLFTPEEIADTTDGWTLEVLQGRQAMDLNGNISLETLARAADPNFDYTVAVPNPASEPLIFKASDLSEGRRSQFQTTSVERVAALLKPQADAAALDQAQRLWRGEDAFLGGQNSPDRKALELLAEVQVADSPISQNNLQQHMDNCKGYVERFGLLPEPYARTVALLVNADSPESAVVGSQIIGALMQISPDAAAATAKPFDDATLLRANMLYGLIQGGTPIADAFDVVKTALARDARALSVKLKDATIGEQSRGEFYGNAVSITTYGPDGVDEYRKMVDAFFLTNGGNRKSAIAVAKARLDGQYAATHIGADKGWRMPLFGKTRRKFRNTPEAVHGKNATAIANDILFRMAPEIARKTGIPCDLEHVILVATPETDWAVAHRENPSWAIARRNDDGTTIFYFDPETGQPIFFSLDEDARKEIYVADLEDAASREKWSRGLAAAQALNPLLWWDDAKTLLSEGISGDPLLEDIGAFFVGVGGRTQAGITSVSQFFHNFWKEHRARKRKMLLGRKDLRTKTPPKATREREIMP
ncbi:MAG: hypothetical protein LBB14_02485 [Puniceicoccales bacterium]|jgi:hypothetical protein|nr:hypothetical protein [Puniceicoccales bacterium]